MPLRTKMRMMIIRACNGSNPLRVNPYKYTRRDPGSKRACLFSCGVPHQEFQHLPKAADKWGQPPVLDPSHVKAMLMNNRS